MDLERSAARLVDSRSTTTTAERTLVVLQPGYLPWLGFFDQIKRSDVFVHYDDVQYDKHGWRNRNRIKSPTGASWLSVPVRHSGLDWPAIKEVEIDRRSMWARKHISTIKHFYAHAPYRARYLPQLEEVLEQPWELLAELNLALVDLLCSWLGLEPPKLRSSALAVQGERSQRLIHLCQLVGATRYLSGAAARAYLDVDLFQRHGIDVEWQDYHHPVYAQQHGAFIPFLSTLDLVLNCGEESMAILSSGSVQPT